MAVHNGRTISTINTVNSIMALLNISRILTRRHPCTHPSLPHCSLKIIIQTTLHRPTNHNRSSHSMARNNHLSSSRFLSQLLLMVIVGLLISMADLHSSGKVLLSMPDPLSIIIIAVVGAFKVAVEVMKHLLWDLPFEWDLTMTEEVIWLKRALPFLINLQIIKAHLPHSLNHTISHTLLKIFLTEDSVHRLIPIHTTLALIGVEAIQILEAEVVVVMISNILAAVVAIVIVTIIAIIIMEVAKDLLQRIARGLQVQMPMARRRRSVAPPILSASHQMVSSMKTAKKKLMMPMKKPDLLLCLVLILRSMFICVCDRRLVLLANNR